MTATDGAGNVQSPSTSATFTLDTAPPVLEILSITPDPAGQGTVTLTVRAMDLSTGVAAPPTVTVAQNGVAAVTATLVGCAPAAFPLGPAVTGTCTYTYVVATGADGLATAVATASDVSGNSATVARQFLVDASGPSFSMTFTPSPVRGGEPVQISVVGQDASSGFGAAPTISILTANGISSGTLTATSCAPAAFPVLPNGPAPAIGNDQAQLTCLYLWTPPTSTATDGVATATITGFDRAGNGIVVTGTVILDNSLPTTTITQPVATIYGAAGVAGFSGGPGSRMNGTATDDRAGIREVGGRLTRTVSGVTTYWNGSTWSALDNGFILVTNLGSPGALSTTWEITNGPAADDWGDGTFTLQVRAVDLAGTGNVQSPVTSVIFIVDSVGPAIVITSITPDPANATAVTITVQASDVTSGVSAAPAVTVTQNGGGALPAGAGVCGAGLGVPGATVTCTY
ncbi:MAG TPA: hypothetical protein VNM48_08090, partial [Chloroflexota bacterium]|nr:hypothetical protein [Chloroflexota bacterium]